MRKRFFTRLAQWLGWRESPVRPDRRPENSAPAWLLETETVATAQVHQDLRRDMTYLSRRLGRLTSQLTPLVNAAAHPRYDAGPDSPFDDLLFDGEPPCAFSPQDTTIGGADAVLFVEHETSARQVRYAA